MFFLWIKRVLCLRNDHAKIEADIPLNIHMITNTCWWDFRDYKKPLGLAKWPKYYLTAKGGSETILLILLWLIPCVFSASTLTSFFFLLVWIVILSRIIIHQILSLTHDWSKRVTWLNILLLKLRNIQVIFLKVRVAENQHHSPHLTWKICLDNYPSKLCVPWSSQFISEHLLAQNSRLKLMLLAGIGGGQTPFWYFIARPPEFFSYFLPQLYPHFPWSWVIESNLFYYAAGFYKVKESKKL